MKPFLFLLLLASCSSAKVITHLNQEFLTDNLGKKVTLRGKTVNNLEGARLILEGGGSIWMNNLDEWPEGYYLGEDSCKTVIVTGRIIQKNDRPVYIYKKGEPLRSGIPVPEGTDLEKARRRFLLDNAKWEVVEE